MSNLLPSSPHQNFEEIKKIDLGGIEYWAARDLMKLLEYKNWRDFQNTIDKAIHSAKKAGQSPQNHFVHAGKMIKIASGSAKETFREIEDYKLSRYGCYLIAQNGDPRKPAIATAQTYFAIQTRRQELSQSTSDDYKRLYIRDQVKKQNKKLFSTAHRAGVTNFGKFNNMGYLGLYGLSIPKIKQKKNIGKDDILDRANSTELAANLFRITQTEEKLNRENITGQGRASITHLEVGTKVRKSIAEIGGTMPENLPPAPHIKKLTPGQQKLLK